MSFINFVNSVTYTLCFSIFVIIGGMIRMRVLGCGGGGGCSGCELNWEGGRMGVEVREDTKCFAVTFSLFQGVL